LGLKNAHPCFFGGHLLSNLPDHKNAMPLYSVEIFVKGTGKPSPPLRPWPIDSTSIENAGTGTFEIVVLGFTPIFYFNCEHVLFVYIVK